MKAHARLTEEALDRAALYVLGGMPEAEAARFEDHLADCRLCREEVSALRPVVEDLLLVAHEAEPPAGLKERVLERIRPRPYTLLRAATRPWLRADVPGVEISQLWLDPGRQRQTVLIRLEAGASLPTHRHGGPEECYVLQGDLRDAGLQMRAGDYIRFDPGTSHTVSSDGGCLLLVTGSLHDRRVEPPTAVG